MGEKDQQASTVPCKVAGRGDSVLVCLIPASRGTSIVSAPVSKPRLPLPNMYDCYTSSRGCTATQGKEATFDAISKTYSRLTVDLWKETVFIKSPYQGFTDYLVKSHARVSIQRNQSPAVAVT
ncbi:hypothetical protein STEG23_021707 [Scotinomys teguina]